MTSVQVRAFLACPVRRGWRRGWRWPWLPWWRRRHPWRRPALTVSSAWLDAHFRATDAGRES